MTDKIIGTIRVREDNSSRGWVRVTCPQHGYIEGGYCEFPVWRHAQEGVMRNWKGDAEKPTVTPSIDCLKCNRHFSIVDGIGQ